MTYWLAILVGVVGGIAAALQAIFASVMGQKFGDLGSVFFTYSIGGIIVSLAVVATAISSRYSLSGWQSLPWYAYLAGPLGLVIVGSFSFTVPRVGVVLTTGLFILAWLFSSSIIEHLGLFGVEVRNINLSRILGIAALLLGTYLVSK